MDESKVLDPEIQEIPKITPQNRGKALRTSLSKSSPKIAPKVTSKITFKITPKS
jgi:hypothetical protein